MGTLRVSAFLGDGVLGFSDFDSPGIILGEFSAPPAGRTDYVIDSLSLLASPIFASSVATGSMNLGIRFELLDRGGAYIMDTAYSGLSEVDFASTSAPYFEAHHVAPVPLPGAGGLLLGLGLAPLMLLGKRRVRRLCSKVQLQNSTHC
jgi:hypothetical protein